MEFSRSKCPLIIRIYLWYYRLLQTTFGGLMINSNGQLATNKHLRYYGLIVELLITATEILGLYLVIKSNLVVEIYNSGYVLTYYLSIIFSVIEKIRVFANLWFLHSNGIEFFEIFYHHKIERRINLYLLLTLWVSHILIPIIFGLYEIFFTNELETNSLLSLIFFQEFCSFSVAWSVPFLMWNVSIHAYEKLVNMKEVLIKTTERNSGITQLKFT
jgi:hypothetical protein